MVDPVREDALPLDGLDLELGDPRLPDQILHVRTVDGGGKRRSLEGKREHRLLINCGTPGMLKLIDLIFTRDGVVCWV